MKIPTFGSSTIDRYIKSEKVGGGAYGTVYKAMDTCTGELVAIKKIKLEVKTEGIPSTSLREITILHSLNNPNVVRYLFCYDRLLDVVMTDTKLYLIFEYLPYDLKAYSINEIKQGTFNDLKRRKLFYETVKSVAFLHSRRILHRDLKPQNILVTNKGQAKVADFGLARQYTIPIKAYTHEIVTVWYRAPEVLLGTMEYATSVDTWSLGCILAELYKNEPLFPGDSEIGQLFKIFQVLGTPTEEEWKGVSKLKEYKDGFPKWKEVDLKIVCPNMNDDGIDLLRKMLTYDPIKRICPKDALRHPYFNGIAEQLPT